MGCDSSKDATAERRGQGPTAQRQPQQRAPQGTTASNAYPSQQQPQRQQYPQQSQTQRPAPQYGSTYPSPQVATGVRPVCQYFMQGYCRNGVACPHLHPMYVSAPAPNAPYARPVCSAFMAGACRAGPNCPYAHVAPTTGPYPYGQAQPGSMPPTYGYANGAPPSQPQRGPPVPSRTAQQSNEEEAALHAALAASVTDHREDEERRQLNAALEASTAAAEREALELSLAEERKRQEMRRRSSEGMTSGAPRRTGGPGTELRPQAPAAVPPSSSPLAAPSGSAGSPAQPAQGAVDIRSQDPMQVFAVFPYAPPKNPNAESADDKNCAICFDDYAAGALVMALPCLHRFHAHCARDWIIKQPVCPSCNCDVYNTGSLTLRA